MKADRLKFYIEKAVEAYELAATPRPSNLPEGDELRKIRDKNEEMFTTNRQALLNHAIDVKQILDDFLKQLKAHHGEKRCQRLMEYTMGGYPEKYSYAHRQQIIADHKRLKQKLDDYKKGK